MSIRFLSPRKPSAPVPAPEPDLEPTVLAPERPVEQPEPPSSRRRPLLLAAVGGIGIGMVTWFGVVPALAGAGGPAVEALPPSSMAVQAPEGPAGPAAEDPGVPAQAGSGLPADAEAAPAGQALAAGEHSHPEGPPRPAPTPRDPFAPLADVTDSKAEMPEPVTLTPRGDVAPGPSPTAAPPAPAPTPTLGPAAGRPDGGVEFTGEPVTVRLESVTVAGAGGPSEARLTLGGVALRLAPGESFASLRLLAVGEPCGAFQVAGEAFVLCPGQERTLRFGA